MSKLKYLAILYINLSYLYFLGSGSAKFWNRNAVAFNINKDVVIDLPVGPEPALSGYWFVVENKQLTRLHAVLVYYYPL